MGQVLERVKPEYLRRAYKVKAWQDAEDFLGQVARNTGGWLGARAVVGRAQPAPRAVPWLAALCAAGMGAGRRQRTAACGRMAEESGCGAVPRCSARKLPGGLSPLSTGPSFNPGPGPRPLAGKLSKGGEPDLNTAARMVLYDWQRGKIPFFTLPPDHTDEAPAAAGEGGAEGGEGVPQPAEAVTEEDAKAAVDGDPEKAAAAARAMAAEAAAATAKQRRAAIPVQQGFFTPADEGRQEGEEEAAEEDADVISSGSEGEEEEDDEEAGSSGSDGAEDDDDEEGGGGSGSGSEVRGKRPLHLMAWGPALARSPRRAALCVLLPIGRRLYCLTARLISNVFENTRAPAHGPHSAAGWQRQRRRGALWQRQRRRGCRLRRPGPQLGGSHAGHAGRRQQRGTRGRGRGRGRRGGRGGGSGRQEAQAETALSAAEAAGNFIRQPLCSSSGSVAPVCWSVARPGPPHVQA